MIQSNSNKLSIVAAMKIAAFFLVSLTCTLPQPANAAAQLTVNPVVIRLPASVLATSLKLHNDGGKEAYLQAEIFEWSQPQGDDVLTPTRSLLVSPPVFKILPGKTQVVRIGRLKPEQAQVDERSYRLIVSEFLPKGQVAEARINTMLKLSLPVFVPPIEKSTSDMRWQVQRTPGTDDLQMTVRNQGHVSGKITGLSLLQNGETVANLKLHYPVLAGATRQLAWPAALQRAHPGLPLELVTDLGRAKPQRQPLGAGVISIVPLPTPVKP